MAEVKSVFLAAVLAFVIALLSIGLIVGLGDVYANKIAPMHDHSPTHYGIKATSLLQKGVKTDSILCIKKTWGGKYTARAKGYYGRGHLVTAKDSKFDGHRVCNHTTHNLDNHWAGVNPWGGSNETYWNGGSNHQAN